MLTLTLHPYQDSAVDFALERGSLLIAYEMGLGKTIVSLAICEELLGRDEIDSAMLVVPASLKYQWAEEVARATDVDTREISVKVDGEKQTLVVPTEEYCVIVDGGPKQREAQYAKISEARPDYVILAYENVVNDWNQVRRIKPGAIVLDEATAIKSFKAKRTRKIKRLSAPYRFALTGTPVENGKPEEIYSIMQWVDDDVLGRFDLYDKTFIVRNGFGGVKRYKNLPVLHAKLAEAMVRKTRQDDDVRAYLPEMQEKVVDVTLDAKTKKVYRVISDDLLRELRSAQPTGGSFDLFAHYHGGDQPDENSAQGRIMARMQALEMLLDHPDLIVMSGMAYEESERQREAGVEKKTWPGSAFCYQIWQDGLLDEVTASPKLDATVEEIETILDSSPKNKVVLFSFYKGVLQIIEDALPEGTCVQYHGGMNAGEKAAAKGKFRDDPNCRVFLASHAGAFGTDLWMANYLINYDLAWSSGKQDQINARHSRVKSTFENIFVLNMITKDTVEVRKYRMLGLKRKVGSAITDNSGADERGAVVNDLTSMTEFLESSAA